MAHRMTGWRSNCLSLICGGAVMALAVQEARGFAAADADTAFASYNSNFYSQTGPNAYYKDSTNGGRAWFWNQAIIMEMVADTYDRTGNTAQRDMLAALCNGFVDYHGQNWGWNEYNDDLMWACIVFAKAWLATGNASFRDRAVENFNLMWNRAWDGRLGGGMYWRTDNQVKNSTNNCPAAIVACYLHEITGDATYLQKAEMTMAWVNDKLVSKTGAVYDHMNLNGVITPWIFTYNQGTYVGASNYLYKITGNPAYYDNALRALRYTREHVCDADGILPTYGSGDSAGFNGVGIRWLARFVRDQNLWAEFYPWLKANADAAWNIRRADNLSWHRWKEATPTGLAYAFECFGSVTALQVVPASSGLTVGDLDADWLPDSWELSFPGVTQLSVLGPSGDFDGDGLKDTAEYTEGSDPTDPDSDDDGFRDGLEVMAGFDPKDSGDNPGPGPAVLAHRYSFITNARDSVGKSDLTLVGAASVSGGALILPGGATRTNHAAARDMALADLAETIEGSAAVTMETWFRQNTAQNWAKVFMAGRGNNYDYMDITPRRGIDGNVSSLSCDDGTTESTTRSGAPLQNGADYYCAAIWDSAANQMTLRIGPVGGTLQTFVAPMNGKFLYQVTVRDFFLGAAVQFGDPDFNGRIDEFRIWKGALTTAEVESHFVLGSEQIQAGPVIASTLMDATGDSLTLESAGLINGWTYRIESATTLGGFTPMAGTSFIATGGTATIQVPVSPATEPVRFFRLAGSRP